MKFLSRAVFFLAAVLAIPMLAYAQNVTYVSSIAALRLININTFGSVYVTQFSSTTRVGGGQFTDTGASSCSTVSPTGGDDGGVYIQTVGDCAKRDTGGQPYNVDWFGAQNGGVQVYDGRSTNTSATLTTASPTKFTSGMVGWVAVANNAASSNQQLVSTISTVNSSSSITLNATAGATNTGEKLSVYPDSSAAITAAVHAANAAGTAIIFSQGQIYGASNNGSAPQWIVTGPGVYLNGATVWLGQTGPTSDTGWSFYMEGTNYSGTDWTGPKFLGQGGTLDGLYQTNQGIQQNSIVDAIIYNDGGGQTQHDAAIIGPLTIQNTKGTAISAELLENFTLTDILTQNCGDFSYQHSSTPGDMTGRPMCVAIETSSGSLLIKNLTSNNAAQSGLLIQNSSGGGPANFDAEISNYSSQGAGYYGLDIEQISGSIHISNFTYQGNSVVPAGVIVAGGFIGRDIAHFANTNTHCLLCTSNAYVLEATDGNVYMRDWYLNNIGLNALGKESSYIAWAPDSNGDPQSISIIGMQYDRMIFQYSGPVCQTRYPQLNVLDFTDIHASSQSSQTYDTIFEPNGSTGTFTYIHGRDSSLGRVSVDSAGSFTGATLFDWPNIFTQGTPTVTGGISTLDYGPTTISQPTTSFICPS